MTAGSRVFDVASLSDTLKVDYEPGLQQAFAERTYDMMKLLTKAEKGIRGGYLHIENEMSRMPGGSFGGERSPYPYPNVPKFAHFKVRPAWLRGTGQFTKQSEDDSKEGALAYVQSQRGGMDRLTDSLARQAYRQMYGDRAGRLAVVSSFANPNLQLQDDDKSPDAGGDPWLSPLSDCGTRRLLVGEYVQVININDGTGAGTVRVDAGGNSVCEIVAITNKNQIVLDLNLLAVAQGDFLVVAEAFNSSSKDSATDPPFAPYGFNEIIHDGLDDGCRLWYYEFYGEVDRSASTIFDSNVVNKAGVALAEADLNNMSNGLFGKTGSTLQGGEYVIACSPDVFAMVKYWNDTDIRYEPRTSPLGMPDQVVTWVGMGRPIEFMVDWMCPPRTMYFVHKASMRIYENIPLQFVNDDGNILRPIMSGSRLTDEWQYNMRRRYQIFSPSPHKHGRITRIGGTDPDFGKKGFLASL